MRTDQLEQGSNYTITKKLMSFFVKTLLDAFGSSEKINWQRLVDPKDRIIA